MISDEIQRADDCHGRLLKGVLEGVTHPLTLKTSASCRVEIGAAVQVLLQNGQFLKFLKGKNIITLPTCSMK